MTKNDRLKTYRDKRDFRETPEPEGRIGRGKGRRYLIQKHDARRLHYDFRLEHDGVLKSWAVTKGPSLDPGDKRLAVETEDHPLDYGDFEGIIPKGYGAGTVMLWDRGSWQPKGDPDAGLKKGVLKFTLEGERLRGGYALVRMKKKGREKRDNWLLVKERDDHADPGTDPTEKWRVSVGTGRSLDAIANGAARKKKTPAAGKKPRSAQRLAFVKPQLATLRDEPPTGKNWLHEIKFDGYRIQALVSGGAVRLITRNGKDWTGRYRVVADALAELDVDDAIIDGEMVAVDENGRSRFGRLQNAGGDEAVELRYYAFDLLRLNGKDLKREPLMRRKDRLQPLVDKPKGPVLFSGHIVGEGERVVRKACAMGMEGIVSKKADAPYLSGRGTAWIKSKCIGNDEFVIIGYRRSDKSGRPFASLLLGAYEDGKLVYRGRVGTGFNERLFKDLARRMTPLVRETSPLAETPGDARRGAVWLTPSLVAQIAYTEMTSDGLLRHPSFLGLREDKPAEEVAMPTPEKRTGTDEDAATVGKVRITHPDRVMYPGQGATKRAIAEYYRDHADRILPFVKDRPLSLLRCPSGRNKACFFQKHHNASVPEHVDQVAITEKGGKKSPYLVIREAAGLIAASQIGALELHLWGARTDAIEKPERLVFDLDPDPSVGFADVRDAAMELRDVLEAADLVSYPLLTGGKGIHVVVPITRRREWPEIKAFARGLARKLAAAAPKRYVAEASKAKRKGRIFIDWLRNERGATAIAPYSLRARSGAPVATPVSWKELPEYDSAAAYTLETIGSRLAAMKADPWPGYFDTRQAITDARLDFVADR